MLCQDSCKNPRVVGKSSKFFDFLHNLSLFVPLNFQEFLSLILNVLEADLWFLNSLYFCP